MKISVVIPALNSSHSISSTIESVLPYVQEIIVVDGGSQDRTLEIASKLGVKVISAEKGRGHQMSVGAAISKGEWLLFLHSDTSLREPWAIETAAFISESSGQHVAATFQFSLNSARRRARLLELLVNWRAKVLKLPYGDQGLVISRAHYEALGGFKDFPLMEDVDIVRRIGGRNLVNLKSCALTSAGRWERSGWVARTIRNLSCLFLYSVGVSPSRISRIYG